MMRLIDDMRTQAVKLAERASAYKLAGDTRLAWESIKASRFLHDAIAALETVASMEAESE